MNARLDSTRLLIGSLILVCAWAPPALASWAPVALTDSLGAEIDSLERDAYRLFPGVEGFGRARTSTNGSSYRVEVTGRENGVAFDRTTRLTSAQWEATRRHAQIVERYRGFPAASGADSDSLEYRLALRFAAEARHDVSRVLIVDLNSRTGPLDEDVDATLGDLDRILGTKRTLYGSQEPDRSGRSDLLIFAGTYGLWTGVAIPVALDADDEKAFAAALLAAPTTSLIIASAATRNADIGVGRAHVIALGGWLGTFQGIGWSSLADGDNPIPTGLFTGYAGVAAASALTSRVRFSEGRGVLTSHALGWGSWFGLVAAGLADSEGDTYLRSALIGSDALVVGTAIAARNARLSKSRVRLISLMGIVGTVAGLGVDILAETDSAEAAWAILGFGSVAGLAIGATATSHMDDGKDLSRATPQADEERWSLGPDARVIRDPESGQRVPAVGVRATF